MTKNIEGPAASLMQFIVKQLGYGVHVAGRDWPRQWVVAWGLARRHQERDTIAGRSLASAPSAP